MPGDRGDIPESHDPPAPLVGSPVIAVRSPGDTSVPTGSGSVAGSAPSPGLVPRPPRATFDAGELAAVCSYYDLGVIEAIKEYRRGSSRAPKVSLKTARGAYLLKRRALTDGRDVLDRIRFSHAVQRHLAERRFPLPHLVAARDDGRTALVREGHVYELFEFVPGNGFDGSLDASGDAGRLLGFFHRLLGSYNRDGQSGARPRIGSNFHAARGVEEHLGVVRARVTDAGERSAVVDRLRVAYADAAARVERIGIAGWPLQIIHADWHPGNMVYRGSRIIAVIDYDTVRLAPRAIDIANGALQFSIAREGEDPERWPEGLDEGRLKRFCRGYDLVKGCIISSAELEALPWLMIEALIVEAAVPIAATGSFGRLEALPFLRMVDAKAAWIARHAPRLTELVAE